MYYTKEKKKRKENAVEVKDTRPISLTTLTFKVIAKVLAERLKKVMPSIIAPTQSAFIEGRQIMDPIFIAMEGRGLWSQKEESWILQLDLEKAFDHVNWDFLEKVLKNKHFDKKMD